MKIEDISRPQMLPGHERQNVKEAGASQSSDQMDQRDIKRMSTTKVTQVWQKKPTLPVWSYQNPLFEDESCVLQDIFFVECSRQ